MKYRSILALCLLSPLIVACGDDVSDDNQALLRIALAHREAMEMEDMTDRLNNLTPLPEELEAYILEYPNSPNSLKIVGNTEIAGISFEILSQEISQAELDLGIQDSDNNREDANLLALSAGMAYDDALSILDPAARLAALNAIPPILDRIINDFPASEISLKIIGNESVAGVNRSIIEENITRAENEISWLTELNNKDTNLDYILTAAAQYGSDLDGLETNCVKTVFSNKIDLEQSIGIRFIIDNQLGRRANYETGYTDFTENYYNIPQTIEAIEESYQQTLYTAFETAQENCQE